MVLGEAVSVIIGIKKSSSFFPSEKSGEKKPFASNTTQKKPLIKH